MKSTSYLERLLISLSIILSIVAAYATYQIRGVTLYGDAVAHLLIARRTVDGMVTGFAQLGSYWLPLPHLLAVPFIMFKSMYASGFAGAVWSMFSYVVACLYIYKTGYQLTKNVWTGIVAFLVFALNVNVLYMQSTSMTEMLTISLMVVAVYYFLLWSQEDKIWQLSASSLALCLCGFTRYEAWILSIMLLVLFAYVAWRKKYSYKKFEGMITLFAILALLCVVLWIAWGWVIFGDPLVFQRGEFSKADLWVSQTDPYVGNWKNSFLTYGYAIIHIVGWPLTLVALLSFAVFLFKERLSAKSIVVLVLLGFIPFFVIMLYKGERPIYVPEVANSLYNIRFALVIVAPISILVGYLATVWKPIPVIFSVLLVSCFLFAQNDVILLREGQKMDSETPQAEVAWFREHYKYGRILAGNFGNERLFYYSGVPLDQNIYEGTTDVWEKAIEDPIAYDVEWLVMRKLPNPDRVWDFYQGANATTEAKKFLAERYVLRYDDERIRFYQKIP